MAAVTFDTYAFIKRLIESGISDKQAEAISDAVKEAHETSIKEFATKNDLRLEISRIENKIDTLELRLTIKLGTIVAIGIAIVATLVKLL